jgi:acetyl esterase/lipase
MVKANISTYNGNPNQVFITGHSAGLLGALAIDPKIWCDLKVQFQVLY